MRKETLPPRPLPRFLHSLNLEHSTRRIDIERLFGTLLPLVDLRDGSGEDIAVLVDGKVV